MAAAGPDALTGMRLNEATPSRRPEHPSCMPAPNAVDLV